MFLDTDSDNGFLLLWAKRSHSSHSPFPSCLSAHLTFNVPAGLVSYERNYRNIFRIFSGFFFLSEKIHIQSSVNFATKQMLQLALSTEF